MSNQKSDKDHSSGPFQLAENQQAYLKAGIMGFAGSGKTFTASLMAKGIYERLKTNRPVFFMDTETGSDFLVPKFKEWLIPFYVTKSRAFTSLLEGVKAAEKDASVLIIDSISHFWREVQDAYKRAKNRNRLVFQDWMAIKDQWARFTDLYLNSQVHIIMCGRAGYEYDFFEDESGAKQLAKTGTKMKAETDMGFEPSLLLEMVRERIENKDGRVEGKLWNHVCYVLKDRTTLIHGQKFINPDFKCFEPVFNFLNIGGQHIGVKTDKDSTNLFRPGSDENFFEKKRLKEVLIEEIQGELVSAFPGQSAEDKKTKTDLIAVCFGTRSWTALADMDLEKLKSGLQKIREEIKKTKTPKPTGGKNK
jgi:hypothetical protein